MLRLQWPGRRRNPEKIRSCAKRPCRTAVGAERLYERIALAADNVCGMNDEGVALLFDRDYLACKDKAIADAVAKVDQPKLTAIMDQRISSQELAEAESRVARS